VFFSNLGVEVAGSIFVSKELRLPVSTQQFDYLIERIRPAFSANSQSSLRRIYSPMDDGGMSFISAENEDGDGFKSFFQAVAKAKLEASSESSLDAFIHLWNDLLDKIRLDPRFSSNWESSKISWLTWLKAEPNWRVLRKLIIPNHRRIVR